MDLPVESLPAEIRAIAELIGLEATLRLVDKFGGMTITFVRGARADTRDRRAELDELLGADNVGRLIQHFGDVEIYCAKCADAVRAVRDREIVLAYDGGARMADLVRRYRLSDRRLKQILKTTDVSARPTLQAALF